MPWYRLEWYRDGVKRERWIEEGSLAEARAHFRGYRSGSSGSERKDLRLFDRHGKRLEGPPEARLVREGEELVLGLE